jgi:hypothetical protein
MSHTSENLTKWESDTGVSGITSASLLVIVLVATAFGALRSCWLAVGRAHGASDRDVSYAPQKTRIESD